MSHQVAAGIEVLVAEMRREHPRWGAKRIRMELLRRPVEGRAVPSTATVNRILRQFRRQLMGDIGSAASVCS